MWRVALVAALVLASAPARAGERNARLVYVATACSAADLAAAVTGLMGRDPFTRDGELAIHVTIEAEGAAAGRLRAVIEIPEARVRARRFEAASCRELTEALAFVIAMALADPDAARRERELRERAREAPPARARPQTAVHLDAIAGAAASVRLRPHGYAGVRARRGGASLGLELAADLPDTFAEGAGQVTIHRAAAILAPCAHRGSFAGCATLSAGVFRGRGEGFMDARAEVMPMAVAGGRIAWEQALTGWLRLQVRAEAEVTLTRNRFLVDEAVVWVAPRAEGRVGIGVLARFP
jgi:hypothetical protein